MITATKEQPETLAPGIHYDVPAEVYHSMFALSGSWMDKLRVSPAHLRDSIDGPPEPPKDSLLFGSACHCAVLEPDSYADRYIAGPDINGNTKAYRLFKEEAQKKGLTVLNAKQGRICEAMAVRARNHRTFHRLLNAEHQVEVSVVWELDGYLCKCRPDLVNPTQRLLSDYKTTISASKTGFAREIARYHYHTKASWYMDAMSHVTGESWDTFWFIAQEKRRPYLIAIHEIERGSAAYEQGRTEYLELFDTYKNCMKSGIWPGYTHEPFTVELPEWAATQEPELEEEPF